MEFQQQKEKQLSKKDKSNIGKIDEKIRKLVDKINKKKDYYTTSSCSGRIVLIKSLNEKQPDIFLYRTHNKLSVSELLKALNNISYKGLVEFKLTSCILHVACKTLDDAFKLVNKAKLSGWKHSGVMNKNRNMIELMGTENISFPIMENKKLLVDDKFLKIIINESNKKLERIWKKIDRLEEFINVL